MEYKLADPHASCKITIKLLETLLNSTTIDRDIYKAHRDEIAMAFGQKVGEVIDEHMKGREKD